jgi:tetratricopeptide (TPR) repeat protein
MSISSYAQLGNNAFLRGDYSRALDFYNKAVAECFDPECEEAADLYGNMGNVYSATGQASAGIAFYQHAVTIYRNLHRYAKLGSTYLNIGNLYLDQEETQHAIHFYEEAETLLACEKKWGDLSVLYGNRALIYLRNGQCVSALANAKKGLSFAKKSGGSRELANAYHRLARAYEVSGHIDGALRQSVAAYALFADQMDELGSAAALYHQVGLYEAKQDIEAAIRCMEQVVAIDEKYNLPKKSENQQRLSCLRTRLFGKNRTS